MHGRRVDHVAYNAERERVCWLLIACAHRRAILFVMQGKTRLANMTAALICTKGTSCKQIKAVKTKKKKKEIKNNTR